MGRSICVALFSCFSIAALGQHVPERKASEFSTVLDPVQMWKLQDRALDAGWPDTRAICQWNDNRNTSTVSLKELEHKIPKTALKQCKRGVEASKNGDLLLAKECFKNAIDIDPNFADAHNDLGVVLAGLRQVDESIDQFEKTIDLAPRNTAALINLNLALFAQHRYHDVCLVARQALNIDPTLTPVRYVLALSLIADHGDATEALANLARAARQYPQAHIAASNVLAQIGDTDEAARQLEAYLKSAPDNDPRRIQIEARLAQLRQ